MERNNELEKISKSLEEAESRQELFQLASLISEKTLTDAKSDDRLVSNVFKEGLYGVDNCTKQESIFFLKVNKLLLITYHGLIVMLLNFVPYINSI